MKSRLSHVKLKNLLASSLQETHKRFQFPIKHTSTLQNLPKQDVENVQTPTLIGYLTSPRAFVILTDCTASTT